jgi:hypothetical protein
MAANSIYDRLIWTDCKMYLDGKGPALASIQPDLTYPSLWRFRLSGGELSDIANLTRARDAARVLVSRQIRVAEACREATGIAATASALPWAA